MPVRDEPDRAVRSCEPARSSARRAGPARSSRRCTCPVATPHEQDAEASASAMRQPSGPPAGSQLERHVHRHPDQHDVADRAETRTLPQRDPEQQHGRADDDRRRCRSPARGVRPRPWWKTSHGSRPSPARTCSAAAESVQQQANVELRQTPCGPIASHKPITRMTRPINRLDQFRSMAFRTRPFVCHNGSYGCRTPRIGGRALADLLPDLRDARPGVRRTARRDLVSGARRPDHDRDAVAVRTRARAPRLRLSRATVTAAYDALRSRGFLASRTGAGSYVTVPAGTPTRARRWPGGARRRATRPTSSTCPVRRSAGAARRDPGRR